MTLSGMGPSIAVEGATTRVVFEAYVEEALAPSLHPGQVVVMDNLLRPTKESEGEGAHREARLRAGVPTPLLSPEFNPIEQAFSKVKGMLGGAEARAKR